MDRTFVMVKPDGVARGLIGDVVSRLEAKGLKLVAARLEKTPGKTGNGSVTGNTLKSHFSRRFGITSPADRYFSWYGRGKRQSR